MAPPTSSSRIKRDNLKEDSKENEEDFFEIPPLPLSIFIVFMLVLLWFVCYNVDALPLHVLGPLGQFVAYLANNHLKVLKLCLRFLIMAHLMEAGFAYRVCRRMKISHLTSFKWLAQTLVVGFPSLGLLLRYRKEKELERSKRK